MFHLSDFDAFTILVFLFAFAIFLLFRCFTFSPEIPFLVISLAFFSDLFADFYSSPIHLLYFSLSLCFVLPFPLFPAAILRFPPFHLFFTFQYSINIPTLSYSTSPSSFPFIILFLPFPLPLYSPFFLIL